MKQYFKILQTILISFLFLPVVTLAAEDFATAQQEMKERLPAIDEMKSEGLVGESILGYLEPIKEINARQMNLLKDENRNRKTLYETVASRTDQSVEEVGKQRAIRIAELSKSGLWLQRPSGEWYRKP